MQKRIITAIVALAAFVPVCYFSHTAVFQIVFAFLAAVAVFEMLKCIGNKNPVIFVLSAAFACLSPLLCRMISDIRLFALVFCAEVFFYLIINLTVSVFSHGKYDITMASVTFTTVIYIVSSFTSIVLLRDSKYGQYLYLLPFLGPWISDTFAYFCGRLFGRRKLIEDVSPKKTVEGSIGGILFTGLSFALYGYIITRFFDSTTSPAYHFLILAGIVVSVVSQVGDLIASLIKRKYNIKDYGNIFPGHGGVMDRFDSVLAAAPLLLLIAEISTYLDLF